MNTLKVFVAEDDESWQNIYRTNVTKNNCDVKITANKEEALEVLKKSSFDVAILDVRLDENNEQNIDGLTILNYISSLKEGTRCFLVTGFGTVKITKDALLKYGAEDVFEKKEIGPIVIKLLLEREIEFYKKKAKISQIECTKVLSGIERDDARALLSWESRTQILLNPSGGIDMMFKLFQNLLDECFPIINAKDTKGLHAYENKKIISGYAWSKRMGQAIGIFVGSDKDMEEIFYSKDVYSSLSFGSFQCSKIMTKVIQGNLIAIVLSIPEMPFSIFD